MVRCKLVPSERLCKVQRTGRDVCYAQTPWLRRRLMVCLFNHWAGSFDCGKENKGDDECSHLIFGTYIRNTSRLPFSSSLAPHMAHQQSWDTAATLSASLLTAENADTDITTSLDAIYAPDPPRPQGRRVRCCLHHVLPQTRFWWTERSGGCASQDAGAVLLGEVGCEVGEGVSFDSSMREICITS